MIAFVLNDTSVENHIGCWMVKRGITRLLESYEIFWFSIEEIPDPSSYSNFVPSVVIINGEGTFHHDGKSGEKLLDCSLEWKRLFGCKCVLLNASWFLNPKQSEALPLFDVISARDIESYESMREYVLPERLHLTADFSFFGDDPLDSPVNRLENTYLVSDSVLPEISLKLYSLIISSRYCWVSIFYAENTLKKLKMIIRQAGFRNWLGFKLNSIYPKFLGFARWKSTPLETLSQFVSSSGIVTGRFHHVQLAIRYHIPFLCVSSNTPKIYSVLKAVGLIERLFEIEELPGRVLKPVPEFSAEESKRIDTWIKNAESDFLILKSKIEYLT